MRNEVLQLVKEERNILKPITRGGLTGLDTFYVGTAL
jgi:hypothetical protein